MMMTVAWQGEGSIFLHEGERIVILIFMRDSLRKKVVRWAKIPESLDNASYF